MIVGIGLLLLFSFTLYRFLNIEKSSKIEFTFDEKIEAFLNSDTFGKWECDGAFYYNQSRKIIFYIEDDTIKMTRDYWVHSMSKPGTYFNVKKEEFINVVRA